MPASPIVIFQADDVVFGKDFPSLHLNKYKLILTYIFYAVGRTLGDINGLARL
jgi:hypothetical protein